MVHASFGANAAKIFKLFKILFAIHDPMVNAPSRKWAPNHKVDHLFSHPIQVSTEEFELGCNLSSDEQDTSSQGYHGDKQRVTLKCAGDGFLIDALCEDGYPINLYPRNVPPPKKWIEKEKPPTHS